jgi:hypothetical protein
MIPIRAFARSLAFMNQHVGGRAFLVCLALASLPLPVGAQPKSGLRFPDVLDKADGERLGKKFVANLLAQQPAQNMTNTGELIIYGPGKKDKRSIALCSEIFSTPTNWVSVYETTGSEPGAGIRFQVVHQPGGPNQYWLSQVGAANPQPRQLSGNELMVPFAGSDFWLADLGLEFLHWPSQTVLKTNQVRNHLACRVVDSVNPAPAPNSYGHILSWIDVESGAIVHADAYDQKGEELKTFEPTDFQKVSGQWQLQRMEIRNLQSRTRTQIQFDLGKSLLHDQALGSRFTLFASVKVFDL